MTFALAFLAAAFPIGFTKAPPVDGRTPEGRDAWAELATNGAVFHRCGTRPGQWGAESERELLHMLDRSAAAGIKCAIYIPELSAPDSPERESELRRVVRKFKSHPGLGYWKSADEPEWGKVPVPVVQKFYDIVHEIDPVHPVWMTQAPRGTKESLAAYVSAYDVGAIDIYPVSYPPGLHGHFPNRNLSVVGDYAAWLRDIQPGKPFWMVLQICFSGVTKPGKTLRFPTFPEQRYMSYQSVIHGARGLLYFGGDVEASLNSRDRPLGWNWTFYDRVLRPVLEEFRPSSPLYPALLAPDSAVPVRVEGGEGVEVLVRETGPYLYLLAAKREGETVQARFTGLPAALDEGEVLYEDPRGVRASEGAFTDWFGPNEVHVYRFRRGRP